MAERTQRLQRPPKRRRKRRPREAQLHLDRLRHGGRREGAGRPKTSTCVGHDTRSVLPHYVPVHVTLRVDRKLRLRSAGLYRAIVRSIARAQGRFGMHVLHWSVQSGHLHMIVEATHRRSLSRGMQGLSIRMSKALNKALRRRRGTVFTDRYHVEQLRTPRQVRHAMAYVLNNRRRHLCKLGRAQPAPTWVDPYGSGELAGHVFRATGPPPCAEPRTWLARTGWKRYGLVRTDEVPGG